MNSLLLSIHLVAAGLWLGCVLTEVFFERALQGKEQAQLLAGLHQRVDLFVEIPAFLTVLVTGGLMVSGIPLTPLLYTKIGVGLVAIAANIYCAWLVFRRADAAMSNQWQVFSHLDHLQHQFGAVVLFGILGALGLGVYLHGSA